MKFNEYTTYYQKFRRETPNSKNTSFEEFYEGVMNPLQDSSTAAERGAHLLTYMELGWYRELRPYYKVWPGIVEQLNRVSLDCTKQSLVLPQRAVLLRFAKGKELQIGQSKIHCILGANDPTIFVAHVEATSATIDEFSLFFYLWPTDNHIHNMTIQEQLDAKRISNSASEYPCPDRVEMTYVVTRLLITTFILFNDPTFVQPEVLAKDQEKYDKTKDPKYVEKAKRRGVHGFNIGKEFEKIPHFRRPHLGLRWTGKGGKIPKIVPIKGAVVHPSKLTKVPTGYITPDDVEVET